MMTSISTAHKDRTLWFLVCLMLLAIGIPLRSDAQRAKISGTVVDQSGRSVPYVAVVANRKGETAVLLATADDLGKFSIDADIGQYDVGVPLFVPSMQTVFLTQDKPLGTVNFVVQGAADVSLQLVDRVTGKSIEWAWLVIRRGDDYFKLLCFPMKDKLQIAVPSNIELTISLFAPKYRLWTYRSPASGDATLSVAPTEKAELMVSMDRVEPEVAESPGSNH
jgi:hypothetical protein